MMTRRRVILILAVVLLMLGLWWLLHAPQPESTAQTSLAAGTSTEPSPAEAQASPTPPEQAARLHAASALVDKIFSSPIEFYGRVVDQNGDPVPHADVGYTAADKFNASGSNYTGQTDAQGYFQITGISGAALGVAVRKAGYYFIHNPSDRSLPTSTATFGYSMGPDSYRRVPPTKDKPAVFVLHKMGATEPLVHVGTRYYKVSKDGQPIDVNLETGREVPAGQGDVRFERWANDQKKNQRRHFDWRFRIAVPGGGLVERNGQFDFEAPEDGYEENVEIDMPASLGDKWRSTVDRSYFVKMRDGRYARFNVTIQAAHDNPTFRSDAYLNPTPGSRNLEYDPSKTVKAP